MTLYDYPYQSLISESVYCQFVLVMSHDVIQDSYSFLPEGRLILSCTLEIHVTVPGSFKMCFALLLGSLILGSYGKVAIGTLWL